MALYDNATGNVIPQYTTIMQCCFLRTTFFGMSYNPAMSMECPEGHFVVVQSVAVYKYRTLPGLRCDILSSAWFVTDLNTKLGIWWRGRYQEEPGPHIPSCFSEPYTSASRYTAPRCIQQPAAQTNKHATEPASVVTAVRYSEWRSHK